MKTIEHYHVAYTTDYGFEKVMVHYRRQFLIERLDRIRPRRVVEIGCGAELLYKYWLDSGTDAECWIIVEPSVQFADHARNSNLPNLHVVENYFEDATDTVKDLLADHPDMVICSCLLHEVPSAIGLLAAIQSIMGEQTILHVNVPNSESVHRRLAMSMGLINHTKEMSTRNTTLMQNRVYDLANLKADIASAGMKIQAQGGFFIKPFTHAQMEQINPIIGTRVLDGLYQLGKEIPELASEIFVEAYRS